MSRARDGFAAPKLTAAARSVIRVVLQFLKENSLLNAFQALSAETNVSLNTHSTPDVLYTSIKSGAWDDVLRDISTIEIKVSGLACACVRPVI